MAEKLQPEGESSPMTEESLISQCQQGDLQAFDYLIRRHQDTVYNLAYRLLGNEDDAQDLTQEVFLTCFRKIKTYRGESRFSTWLYRIVVNHVKNVWKYRERRAVKRHESLDAAIDEEAEERPLQVADCNPSPRNHAAAREELSLLKLRLYRLSMEHRQVLLLRYVEGLSYEEIAEVLHCTLGTVKSRISRARGELRKAMSDVLDR
jgi:RNA polymerase sigma-70 factor (ECF subfamily)